MSTAKRFQWLKCLLSLILFIGMSTPTPAEEEDRADTSLEIFFWVCAIDNDVTNNGNYAKCCDGSFCYRCTNDLSLCVISEDPDRARLSPAKGPESLGLNIRPIKESPSEGQLQTVCNSVKASFTNLVGFGYSCVKPNCNGKGDYCTIICHGDRRCTAGTPDVIGGPVSLRGILQNGDNIDRSDSSSAPGSQGGGAGGNEDDGNPCGPDGCLY